MSVTTAVLAPTTTATDHERSPGKLVGLGEFLRDCRARIHAESRALGPNLRVSMRIGRAVTQEELAEAADISRVYYAMLESGRAVHVSATVLVRIARALALDSDDRATLYALAVPELGIPKVTAESQAVLDALSSLAPVMRRLWAATTEVEALTIVSEDCFTRFGGPDVVLFAQRERSGQWSLPVVAANADAARRTEAILLDCASTLRPDQIDELMSYGLVNGPGEIALLSEHPFREPIATAFANAVAHVDWPDLDSLFAHVRTRRGLVGQLAILDSEHRDYSRSDRAIVSTLASMTSLALH